MVITIEDTKGKKLKFDNKTNFIIFAKNEFEANLKNEPILKNIKSFRDALYYLVDGCSDRFPKVSFEDIGV